MNESATISPPQNSDEREILAGILSASTDACWCMEFDDPVDLTLVDSEVVRQVFENGPRWRFCNDAMAQLYLLPPYEDLGSRPVSEIFPRNAQNEQFIRYLLSNGFEVNGAPALDRRYDGVEIHVENDVRAHIKDGKLLRMFGVVRDVGKHYRREAELSARLGLVTRMIEMLPDAALGIDAQGIILITNAAADRLMNRPADALIGEDVKTVVEAAWGSSAEQLIAALNNNISGSSGRIKIGAHDLSWTVERQTPTLLSDLAAVLVLNARSNDA